MQLGDSALADLALGGEGGPSTAPLTSIVVFGLPVDDSDNPNPVYIAIVGQSHNAESGLWKLDLTSQATIQVASTIPRDIPSYIVPKGIVVSGRAPSTPVIVNSPFTGISIGGLTGVPVALTTGLKRTVYVKGLVPGLVVEAAPDSTVVVINTTTGGITEYDMDVWGMVENDGNVYVMQGAAVGVFDSAAPVPTGYIETGELQVLNGQEFNVPKVTIGVDGEGKLTIHSITAERGIKNTNNTYSLDSFAAVDQYEVLLETRQAARSYQFHLTIDGKIQLGSLDLYVNPVRHRRG